jgi:hypothetical protein
MRIHLYFVSFEDSFISNKKHNTLDMLKLQLCLKYTMPNFDGWMKNVSSMQLLYKSQLHQKNSLY